MLLCHVSVTPSKEPQAIYPPDKWSRFWHNPSVLQEAVVAGRDSVSWTFEENPSLLGALTAGKLSVSEVFCTLGSNKRLGSTPGGH